MEMYLDYLRELNIYSMMLRVVLAIFAGGLVGFEREKKGRAAGFRTYMLVAMGASLTVILGQYLSIMLDTVWLVTPGESVKTDVSRFAAQVINGVGFLGAGTVIVTGRQQVKGLTTAAGLWASACMGIAIGAGFYECLVLGLMLIFFSMKLLPFIESAILSHARNMSVFVEMDCIECLSSIVTYMKSSGFKLYDVDIEKKEHFQQFDAFISFRLPARRQHTEVLATLSTFEGVVLIEEV